MARQPDIQYIRYYTDGSAARKIEPQPKKKERVGLPQPRVRRDQRVVVHVDPVSVCALLVAAIMLIAMAVGMIRLGIANAQAKEMEGYVAQLQSQSAKLDSEYYGSFELADVEQQALELGMVPKDQLQHVTVDVQIPQAEPELGFWEEVGLFFRELFA